MCYASGMRRLAEKSIRWFLFASILTGAPTVYAAITIRFAGVIDSFTNVPGIPFGSPVNGKFTFSLNDPAWAPQGNPQHYSMSSLGEGLWVNAGAYNFYVGATGAPSGSPTLTVGDAPGLDYLQAGGGGCCGNEVTSTNYVGFQVSGVTIQFYGTPGLLRSTAVPARIDVADILMKDPLHKPTVLISLQKIGDPKQQIWVIGRITNFFFAGEE